MPNSICIYYINLDSRPDRRHAVELELRKLPLETKRVAATDKAEFATRFPELITDGAWACLDSHRSVWKLFLNSNEQYAIISEDDAVITDSNLVMKSINAAMENDLDLLQVGFLQNNPREKIDTFLLNIEGRFFRFLSNFKSSQLVNRKRIVLQKESSEFFVFNDLRAGAHFYLINRKMAELLIEIANGSLIPVDGLIMNLNWANKLRVARLGKSLVGQSGSASSIKVGYIEND